MSSTNARPGQKVPRRATETVGAEEDPALGASGREAEPLVPGARRATTHLENYGSWRATIWTPKVGMRRAAKRWVMVISAFANIAPAGCLVVSRPTGGIFPSLAALAVFGGLALFGAHNYAVALTISGSCTLPDAWRRYIGPCTTIVPILTVAFTCFSCCVGYANFYGHLLADVWAWNPAPNHFESPETWYVVLSGFVPMMFLVCLKDISVMRFSTAVAGLACCLVPVLAAIRYFDGSYTEHGRWGLHTTFGGQNPDIREFWKFHEMPSRLVSIQGVLFLFHFNAVKYFRELEQPQVSRYTWGLGWAILAGFAVVASTMVFVFLTFGHQSMMLTMDNYSREDGLANTARVAVSIGLVGCFPLLFSGMRESLVELLSDFLPSFALGFQTVAFQNALSLGLLCVVVVVTNGSHRLDVLLINVGRCCCGPLLMYTFPGVLYLATTRRHLSREALSLPYLLLTVMVAIFGLVMTVTSSLVWNWYGLL